MHGVSSGTVWAAAAHVCRYLLSGHNTGEALGEAEAPTEEALMVRARGCVCVCEYHSRVLTRKGFQTWTSFLRHFSCIGGSFPRMFRGVHASSYLLSLLCEQIPSDQVGSMIGKAGTRINLIRQASSCKVRKLHVCVPATESIPLSGGGDKWSTRDRKRRKLKTGSVVTPPRAFMPFFDLMLLKSPIALPLYLPLRVCSRSPWSSLKGLRGLP